MKQHNIIQFLPYFPPHVWWVEKVWQEIGKYWVWEKFWNCTQVVFDVWQVSRKNYMNNNCEVILLPSFDIIPNFPFPKFWKISFWKVFKNIPVDKNTRVVTHTRFFLSSLIGWVFAKFRNLKWIHIEHGSDYVKLSSDFKNKTAYIYDRIVWKYIFNRADKILAISHASKKFIETEFLKNNVDVWYRWVDFVQNISKKTWDIRIVFIGRLTHLKWVSDLLQAYKKTKLKNKLILIWDGEERYELEKIIWSNNIEFFWQKDQQFVHTYLSENKCIVVNPSYQEWMPTTVIEWLLSENIVVASEVWGTSEISNQKDLLLFSAGDIGRLMDYIIAWVNNFENLSGLSKKHIEETFVWSESIKNFKNIIG